MSMPYIYIEEGKAEGFTEHLEKAYYHLRKALHCMEEEGLGEEMEKVRKKFMKEMMQQRMGQRTDATEGPGTYKTATGYKQNNKPGSRSRYADEYEESLQQKMQQRMNRKKHQQPFDPNDWDEEDDD